MKRIKLIIITILCIAFASHHLFAQGKEGNIWYFGENAGIDFNQTPPVALTDGRLNGDEGCASMADGNGNLLFYTDGERIWDRTHTVMSNGTGLMGHPGSTQSALIVKKPSSCTIYYVFTVGGVLTDKLHYSEVDMSLNSGLGGVVNKNTSFIGSVPAPEKLTGVRHQNGVDFWVVVHQFNTNAFESYLLSSAGVSTTPVISNIGTVTSSNTPRGYLRASPDGSRIVSANGIVFGSPSPTSNNYEVFDFDNSTGELTNLIVTIPYNSSRAPYGVEFSPNGNLLYLVDRQVKQFNLLAGTPAVIIASRVDLGSPTTSIGAAQLAPDGRIYVSERFNSYLHVIEDPNVVGMGCNFVEEGFYLGGRRSRVGLPNFVNSTIVTNTSPFIFSNLCLMDSTTFTLSTSLTVDSVLWNFGDSTSGVNNTSTDNIPKHVYTQAGDFEVTLIVFSTCNIDTVSDSLSIDVVAVDLGNDTVLCEGEALTLDATTANAVYGWQDGSTDSTFNVTDSGTYWVEVVVNVCSRTDSINVNFNPLPIVNLGNDATLCPGETRTLDATTNGATSYLWQDASTNPIFNATGPDRYGVEVMVSDCSGMDSVELSLNPLLTVNLGNDTVLCQGAALTLDATVSGATYVWQDGSTAPTFNVTDSGTYWVEVTSNCEIAVDTLSILFEDCICNISFPNSFTPNSDNKNDQFSPVTNCEFREYRFVIFDRWGEKMFETNDYNDSWDGTYKGSLCPTGIYVYDIGYVFERLSSFQDRRVFQEKQGRLMLLR